MEGEGERAKDGFNEPAGNQLEISLVDLQPMPSVRIELARLPESRTNESVSQPFPHETQEHFYQRMYRASFEGRIEGARFINSRDINQIENAIKPKDFIQIQSGNDSKYYRVIEPGIVTDGVNIRDLRAILKEALQDQNVKIFRAPPKPPTATV